MPRKAVAKQRGIFERPKGSGIWWISYCDADRLRHREKVGRRSDAIDLYNARKADIRAGKKLPRNIQRGGVTFSQLADDILVYSGHHHGDTRNVKSRIKQILPEFGECAADSIKPSEIDQWISTRTKTAGTFNRYRALFSLIYREAIRNDKATINPHGWFTRKTRVVAVSGICWTMKNERCAPRSLRCSLTICPSWSLQSAQV